MSIPIISGLPAIPCTDAECGMCRGTFRDVFCEWICPHCKSHLSLEHRVCMNLCGLSYPAAQKFNSMLAQAVAKTHETTTPVPTTSEERDSDRSATIG